MEDTAGCLLLLATFKAVVMAQVLAAGLHGLRVSTRVAAVAVCRASPREPAEAALCMLGTSVTPCSTGKMLP